MLASPRGVAHGRGPRLAPGLFSLGTKQGCGSTSPEELAIPSGPEVEVMQTSSDLGSSGSRELFPSDLSMYNSELTLDPEVNIENPSLTSDFK